MDDFGQIAFLIIAVLAWILGEATRARQERKGQQEEAPETAPPPPAPPPRLPRERNNDVPPDVPVHRPATRAPVRRPLPPAAQTPTVAMTHVRRARHPVWRRLGVPAGTSARAATRRAVLWSEVLGRPRALTGPYRGPGWGRRREQGRTSEY